MSAPKFSSYDPANTLMDLAKECIDAKEEKIQQQEKEIKRLRELVNPECEKAHMKIEAENKRLREACIQGLAALGSVDINGYQNSLCKSKALKMLREALEDKEGGK